MAKKAAGHPAMNDGLAGDGTNPGMHNKHKAAGRSLVSIRVKA